MNIRKTVLIIMAFIATSIVMPLNASTKKYSFRKYAHVKKFYAVVTPLAIEVSKKNRIPVATMLAIAGLESGYGRGYVAQITGNILSLGAFKSDPELPALYLPYSKSKKMILFDPHEIKKHSKQDLSYKRRAKSLKKDYRPKPYAGSYKNLELLKYNENLRINAYKACFNDFSTRWIAKKSNIKCFRDARVWLNGEVKQYGVNKVIYSKEINFAFIYQIGGKPNSFNYRESWPKKVELLINKIGLVELVDNMANKHMSFDEAWEKN